MSLPPPDSRNDAQWLDPKAERELAEALRSAYAPAHLDPALEDRLIEAALEDPLAPPTAEEVAESQRLRAALEGRGEHPDAALAEALRTAGAPPVLRDATAERMLTEAMDRSQPSNVIYVAFGAVATVAAAAAALALVFSPAEPRPSAALRSTAAAPEQSLAVSRSSATLFTSKFKVGRSTARVDRIASVRSRELRKNRFVSWGVR
jgi:hypothetical protein